MQPVIFTDLDGTLLDFQDYSYREAESVVKRLQEKNIPLVFCSSKTRVEQEYYREALGNTDPFIVENGSAINVPLNYFSYDISAELSDRQTLVRNEAYWTIILGETYSFIRNIILKTRQEIGIDVQGYADLTLAQIMELTQLDREFAQRAANRDFSETLLTGDKSGSNFSEFKYQLEENGLSCVSGGKFHTVMGKRSDKGKAVQLLTKLFERELGRIQTIGLGDSANDLPFLRVVDKPYLVQRNDESWLEIDDSKIQRVEGIGPQGWIKVANSLISV